jgi:uncharacterized membrane protein
MNRDRSVLTVITLFALAGLSAATYVFVTHSLGYELFCPFATGCDTVQDSPYAVLFGIPVSLLGMAGFTAYIGLALMGLRLGAATRRLWKSEERASGLSPARALNMRPAAWCSHIR